MKKSRSLPNHMPARISGTNESVLTIILLRLPVKSLIIFRRVSKQWSSLISDPYFCHSHTIYSIKKNPSFLSPSGFFIYNSLYNQFLSFSLSRKRSKPSLPSLSFLGQNCKILQSCSGLLLCRLNCGTFCVCNPTTGKFKILPSAKVDGEFSWISPFTLAFDPSRSPNYRVVCFKRIKKESPEPTGSYYFLIFIYLSEMDIWKSSNTFEVNMCPDMAAGIFSNGVVHWACHEQYIRFDMNEEKVMLMRLPFVYVFNNEHSWEIGCLWQWHDTIYSAMKSEENFSLHELDQATLKWIPHKYYLASYSLAKIAYRAVTKEGTEAHKYDRRERKFSVIALVKGDKEKDTAVLIAIFGKVISYNFARRKIKIILDLGLPSDIARDVCCNCLSAYQYVQTLSSV
ncbi:PREDICTED: F-box protein At5g07610-like [Nicotiana attenuata]|nr:PREDICTED: F-box protein At5g07610-like [Nicotiana attenuata]